MLRDVVNAQAIGGYRLLVTFDDGVRGEIDVAEIVPFDGVFAPLQSQTEFARVYVNHDLGSVSWPCGADLDTQVLYARLSRRPAAGEAPRLNRA